MNGKRNMAYFSAHFLKRTRAVAFVSAPALASRAWTSLTRHLSWSLFTRRSAAPMIEMMMEAMMPKTPSQM